MLPGNYDIHGASRRVDELIAEKLTKPTSGVMFPSEWCKFHNDETPDVNCVAYGSPTTYRLASHNNEIIFRMIGVADEYFLPPFDRFRLQSARIPYVQQALSLTGLHASLCMGDMDALHDVFETASRLAPVAVDNSWNIPLTYRVRFSNRLFIPKENAPEGTICDISKNIDPAGTLKVKAEASGLVHTDDNLVEYLRAVPSGFITMSPSSIRKGDIVEVRFSIGLFGNSRSTLFLRLILRAVISIDTSFTRNSARLLVLGIREGPTENPLKRRRVLDDRTNEQVYAPEVAAYTDVTETRTISDSTLEEYFPDGDVEMKEATPTCNFEPGFPIPLIRTWSL